MNHNQIREKILALNDTELEIAEKRQVAEHLKTCGECRDLSGKWDQIRLSLLKTPQVKPSEDFVMSVMSRLEDLEEPAEEFLTQGWKIPDWLFPGLGYSVAVILMFVVVNQPLSFAESTESVLLSDVPDSTQWAFSNETGHPAPLLSAEEELV